MRHSGATDATLDESNEGSCAKELQYDVLPFGESTAHVKQEVDDDFNKSANAHDSAIPSTLSLLGESIFINRTMKEAPPNTFSVPVLQQTCVIFGIYLLAFVCNYLLFYYAEFSLLLGERRIISFFLMRLRLSFLRK